MDLQTWMASKKLVDQTVADAIGVTRPYITRIRAGRVHPTLGTALRILDYTKGKIDIRQLLPIALRPPLTQQPNAKGISRKPLAPKASQEHEAA